MRARLFVAILLLASASAFGTEEAVVLTPKAGPAPRINGARVFGVRPGSPFLFTIAATGERPIRYAAEGLPGGLRLDPATGRIAGSVAIPGTHAVTLSAANRHGPSPTGRARPRPRRSPRTSSTRTSRCGRSSPPRSSSAAT
jgi:alpha-galactosidase